MIDLKPMRSYVSTFVLLAYLGCVPLSNWMILHVGTVCQANSPCLIPVGPNLLAPSGVVVIGFALVLRDIVQLRFGSFVSALAILVGAVLSGLFSPGKLVLASISAYAFSEFLDMIVYTQLYRRNFLFAVVFSSVFGAIADSIVFLFVAFGSLDFLLGQIVGKLWAILFGILGVYYLRMRGSRIVQIVDAK